MNLMGINWNGRQSQLAKHEFTHRTHVVPNDTYFWSTGLAWLSCW